MIVLSIMFDVVVLVFFFFSSRRRHTRCSRDWSSDVCSSDLLQLRSDISSEIILEWDQMHRKFLGLSWSSLQDRRQFLLGLLGCNSRFKPSHNIQELVASDTHPPEIRLYLCPNIGLWKEIGHWRHHTDDGLARPIQV